MRRLWARFPLQIPVSDITLSHLAVSFLVRTRNFGMSLIRLQAIKRFLVHIRCEFGTEPKDCLGVEIVKSMVLCLPVALTTSPEVEDLPYLGACA